MALTVIAYRRAGASFNPYCYLRLWPLPLIYVAIAACCGLYRGTWPQTRPPWNPVLFLKAQFKAVLFTFLILSCYLVFTRVNLRYSRFILAFSWLLLIWLLPAARFAVRKIFHLPATQLDFNAKLPVHDGLLLPIPRIVKAIIEKLIAVLLLLLLSPLGLVLSFLVKLTSRGPVFYISERIGLRGKRFKVLKYRTMRYQAVSLSLTPPVLRRNGTANSSWTTTRASRRSVASSARPAWTNSPSFGTSSWETWTSSAHVQS